MGVEGIPAPAVPVVEFKTGAAPKPINGTAGPQAPAEPKPEAKPPEKPNAALFAALAKKERAARATLEEAKREKAEAAKLRAEHDGFVAARGSAKKAPLEYLKAAGLSYDDVSAAVLNDGKPAPELQVSQVREELEAFKKQQADREAKVAEDAKTARAAEDTRILSEFRAATGEYVKSKGDEFELINLQGAHELVTSVIEEHHARTGKLLTPQEAAVKVETFLEEQARKLTQAKKLIAKGSPRPQGDRSPPPIAPPRTLSNDMTVSTASALSPRVVTEKERIERAIAALSK